jgi:hypothetical protein
MGYRIKNYTILEELAKNSTNENNHIEKIKRDYNLYTFIIHDPITHENFDRYINRSFDRLSYATGDKLLFFALTDYEFASFERGNLHYSRFNNDDIYIDNTSDAATSMASVLNISPQHLPVIVVINNFNNKKFVWYKTSNNCLDKQLTTLGLLATKFPEIKNDWQLATNLFEDYDTELNTCNGTDTSELLDSMATALIDVLSFMMLNGGNKDTLQYEEARRKCTNNLKKLNALLTEKKVELKNENSYSIDISKNFVQFENLNIQIANYLSLLGSNPGYQDLNLELNLFEKDSMTMFRTANKVYNYLGSHNSIIGESWNFDFSCVGICLSKFFEKEINYSFVHWIRKNLGIHLPPFFDKYDPNIRNTSYIPALAGLQNPRPIDFNRRKNSRTNAWSAPGIGESLLCLQSMQNDPKYEKIDPVVYKSISEKWREIVDLRNSIAHTTVISKEQVQRLYRLLADLNDLRLFHKMYELKSSFRS